MPLTLRCVYCMISLNKNAQAAYPTSVFRVLATGLSSILTWADTGFLAACEVGESELVKLLGSGNDDPAVCSENRDIAEAPELV